jgi:hypothetical protein
MRRIAITRSRAALLLVLCGGLAAAAAQAQDQRHDNGRARADVGRQHFDTRFHNNHAYLNRGVVVHALPAQHYDVVFRGGHYFFAGGVWYAPRGGLFVVVAPPFGVFVPVLPPFYTTIWVAGAPYYYADDVYYVYRGPVSGYEVVAPPPDQQVADAPPPGPGPAPASHELFIYPRNGQSPDQQAKDQYECHTWASSQTGFDPTAPGGGVPPQQTASARADYDRAMGACLDARGYTVR